MNLTRFHHDVDLPFESQINEWSCGAAALAMVYRSFSIERNQEQIWPAIRGESGPGLYYSRAQAIAADALTHGLHALVIQARDPWVVLERCFQNSVRVIVNHVPEASSGAGHYSVVTEIADDRVVIHDPNWGPNRTLSRGEFLQLWNPRAATTRILGQVLIAIGDTRLILPTCPLCDADSSDWTVCYSCRLPVVLQPLAILGCLTSWCPKRAWEEIFCPWCDHHSNKRLDAPLPAWRQPPMDRVSS